MHGRPRQRQKVSAKAIERNVGLPGRNGPELQPHPQGTRAERRLAKKKGITYVPNTETETPDNGDGDGRLD